MCHVCFWATVGSWLIKLKVVKHDLVKICFGLYGALPENKDALLNMECTVPHATKMGIINTFKSRSHDETSLNLNHSLNHQKSIIAFCAPPYADGIDQIFAPAPQTAWVHPCIHVHKKMHLWREVLPI